MATTSNPGAGKPAAKRTTTRKSTTGTARKSTARTTRSATAGTTRRTASATTQTAPRTPVEQAQQIAERAVLVQVGASLLARDNLVTTVKGLTSKYSTRAGLEREIKRYERQVRRARAKFERELRQRRTTVQRSVKQNRRQFERQVKSVRKDLEKQSGAVTARVDKLVSDAQGLISN